MFAPKLYGVYKFSFLDLISNDFNMSGDLFKYKINQQDNMLFRQTRLLTRTNARFNKYCVFVSCNGHNSKPKEFSRLITDGIVVDGKQFELSERSASMTRQGILSFVESSVKPGLDEAVSLGIDIKETVLSKYMAYRGLMFSSCHCFEDWVPKIIIVPDYFKTIYGQTIKYVIDETSTYRDKETGEERPWTQKAITTGIKDVEINVFDGAGIHHPSISSILQKKLAVKDIPTSVTWRAPFIKGVTHSVDYTTFFIEHGVEWIEDLWGQFHSVYDEMIIMTESMYKGKSYLKEFGDSRDWERYWNLFEKYNHCIGITKWNFTHEQEPVYTRANYQILQDLELDYDSFSELANYSIDWANKIVQDDIFSTYCFLGLTYDLHNPMNEYVRAILKNPEMIKEKVVKEYIVSLVKKKIDEFKCGKLWLKSCFKIETPDLIAMMEHIAKIEVKGCLEEDEFYSNNIFGECAGEFLIERNPHICKSEHVILKGATNPQIQRYLSHLSNICMINCKSLTAQRLSGSDFDGDLVLLVDNELMKSGVDRNCPIVIDVEDKATALSEIYNKENVLKLILRTMKSLIGETSNCATAYWNKVPKSEETKAKYMSYIDLLSVITGKSIDSAKTGIIFNIPRYIAKYSKPLPYFMKYTSDYYSSMNKLNVSPSNMNRLAKDIEKWEKKCIRFKKSYKDFDYTIMIDKAISIDEDRFLQIEKIFLNFCKEMDNLASFANKCRNYKNFKSYFKNNYPELNKEEIVNFEVDWKYQYDNYKKMCKEICPDKQELANIAVELCYSKYPNKNKKFMWKVASEGILLNIRPQNISLPTRDDNGTHEYLGKKYSIKEVLIVD